MPDLRGNERGNGAPDGKHNAARVDRHRFARMPGPLRLAVFAAGALALQAQSPPSLDHSSPPQTQTAPSGQANAAPAPVVKVGAPFAVIPNNPRSCDEFVQPGVSPSGSMPTFLSYRLTLTGELRGVTLYRSSGNAALDQAAIACAAATHMPVMSIEGKPVEINWVGGVPWNSKWRTFYGLAPDGSSHICPARQWYPKFAVLRHETGAAEVEYHIATDGNVRDVVIARSSGFPLLDNAAIQCASTWKYFPATQDGNPVQIDFISVIYWRMSP